MKDKTVRDIILLGTLAIIAIIGVQTYWLINTWDTADIEFDQAARIALRDAAEELALLDSLPLPDKDLIVRKKSNYYFVNFNNVIEKRNLEHYLYKQFEKQSISSNFRYGIYDCSSDEMVEGALCVMSDGSGSRPLTEKLSEQVGDDKFIYYFSVEFLGRSAMLVEKMKMSIIFTAILLLAVIFFCYAIFIILKQKRLSEMQKEFINNMTHEFKTPISTINVSADVFMKTPVIKADARLSKYAQIIKDQNKRLLAQVEKVLQVAKMEQENFQLKKEELDLHAILEVVVESTKLKVQKKGGTIDLNVAEGQPMIWADKVHFTNIVYNILDNSIKYCKEKPVIRVSTEIKGGAVKLILSDEGLGIPKEHLKRVFDKFYRVPTGNVHNVKGFGLGLFYVKKVIKAHKWGIKIDSKVDQGTTFYVSINKSAKEV